jgi:hypothetical protein
VTSPSSATLSGSVALDGTLPPGWTLQVIHLSNTDVKYGPATTGGAFGGIAPPRVPFGAQTTPTAYICTSAAVPCPSLAVVATIYIQWLP